MIEKDCETCKEVMKVFGDYSPCVACDDSCSNWQPSELYTAYVAAVETNGQLYAQNTEIQESHKEAYNEMRSWQKKAERYREALLEIAELSMCPVSRDVASESLKDVTNNA